ncbi:hypothetical protein SAZ11_61935 [Streptomyces sp. FXJ1.4098]|nr:hypothetical protein [Streptomyces sp. FXJ1.4098]
MGVGRRFFVGAEPTKGWGPFTFSDKKLAGEIAVREMQSLGITRVTDGNRLVGALSGGERQALAIARAVYFGTNVLILAEPTVALGVKEAAHVLRIIMQARAKGVAVILVTHNVRHAMMVGNHFAVLIRVLGRRDTYELRTTRRPRRVPVQGLTMALPTLSRARAPVNRRWPRLSSFPPFGMSTRSS